MRAWGRKKRTTSFLGTYGSSTSAEDEIDEDIADDEEHASGEIYHAERFLPNGDYYTGYWADNFPHGAGKYWWTDGCTFTGDWVWGKKMGKGTFSWPSGAKYEGSFKNGFMDGDGTYTGPSGDSYRGNWVMNMTHGFGVKEYRNGDVYNGEWRKGLQDGQGMYKWKNENFYVGEWRNGSICGGGKLCWRNGNTYEGDWEDGLPKGNGRFQWKDGSFYEGYWSKDPEEQSGTYHPSESSEGEGFEWDPQDLFNVEMKECVVCPSEKVPILPSQKKLAVWRSSKMVDSSVRGPRRMSVDGRIEKSSVDNEFGRIRAPDGDIIGPSNANTYAMDNHIWSDGEGQRGMIPRIGKRQGITICKGHKNYELMLNLQLGIRHSAGKGGPPPSLTLKPSAFDPKEKYWTKFPPEGSKHTPPHTSCEFKWKDYCPKVFRSLRLLFKVDPADYMLSICGDDALRELSSPGKSGSFFYLTHDDRYMIKTIKKAEVKVLLRMLSSYYNHVRDYEHTLVTKYFGLHCVKLNGTTQKKVRFVIMGNLFCTSYTIHRRYDLKGSTFGRITAKPESAIDSNTTLKDLDLNFIFRLQNTWFKEFIRQVNKDCELLEQERIMDYSLLVGLHFIEENGLQAQQDDGETSMKLGISMPTRVERTERRNSENELQLVGDPTGEYYNVVMFFGIIDILQDYDITKKLEHAYKSMQYDPNTISAVDPRQYSKRFRDYIFKVVAEDF